MEYTIFEYFTFFLIIISLTYLIFQAIINYKTIFKILVKIPSFIINELLIIPLFFFGVILQLFNKNDITNSDSKSAIDFKVLKINKVIDKNYKKRILFLTDNLTKVQTSVDSCLKTVPNDFKNFKYNFKKNNSKILLDLEISTLYQFYFLILWFEEELKNIEIVGFAKNINNEKESYYVIYNKGKIDVNLLLAKKFKNELFIIDIYKSNEQQIIEYDELLDLDFGAIKKYFKI